MSLDVYLHGKRVGSLFRCAGGCGLAYLPALAAREDAAASSVSRSLPVRAEPYGADAVRPYVEGLLPEGDRRHRIARELALAVDDSYGLIAALGRDCPGAVVFQPEGEPPPAPVPPGSLAWLDEEELRTALSPPGEGLIDREDDRRMRFALPGERHKLALVRDGEDDRWAWPQPGAPSTHVLKPEAPEQAGLIGLEMASALAYRSIGLPVAHTAIERIAGQPVLVSKRFDRWGQGDAVERLHQESFSQALGRSPGAGPVESPSLAECARLLRAVDAEADVHTLLLAAFCDLTIGNHGRIGGNRALLVTDAGPMLAPLYDIAATEVYGEARRRPLTIGAPPAPFLVDLARAISDCEFEFQPKLIEAVEAMNRVSIALGEAAGIADRDGWYARAIDEAVDNATTRVLEFHGEMQYLRPPGADR